jgi:hypothetical protein
MHGFGGSGGIREGEIVNESVCDRRARDRLLALFVVGALLTACGEMDSGERGATPPQDVVAVVNGQAITRDAFERYVESAAAEGETAASDAENRRRLLLQMVDEELLFQRAIALGLHRRDPAAHRAILSAVIASVTSEGEAAYPDEAALRSHYEENAAPFDEVRGEVRGAYLRERREQALRDALDVLHREADIRVLARDLVAP